MLAETPSPPEPSRPPLVIVPEPATRRSFVPTSRDEWLRLAERVVGDWTATLRAALVLVLLFAAAVTAIGVMVGPPAAAVATLAGLVAFLIGRSRGGLTP
ncbi:MAG TPA: hypothetical protein VHH15_00890 [Actinophytocola sp.]|nr:hypothetical protein [Actinophytocola sp.]